MDTWKSCHNSMLTSLFAAFGKDAYGRQFLPNARLRYGEAIVQLNEALGDPVAVKKDETLMAVLLMGMVEVYLPSRLSYGYRFIA
jgi:hypothetical protein